MQSANNYVLCFSFLLILTSAMITSSNSMAIGSDDHWIMINSYEMATEAPMRALKSPLIMNVEKLVKKLKSRQAKSGRVR